MLHTRRRRRACSLRYLLVSTLLHISRFLKFCYLDLPQTAGWLAYWQLFIAVTAAFNSVQNFVTLKLTRKLYNGVPSASGTTRRQIFFLIAHLTVTLYSNRSPGTHICSLDTHVSSCTCLCSVSYSRQNVLLGYLFDDSNSYERAGCMIWPYSLISSLSAILDLNGSSSAQPKSAPAFSPLS